MDVVPVKMLQNFNSNNKGETCSFERPLADKLIGDKVARELTPEETDAILDHHEKHAVAVKDSSKPGTTQKLERRGKADKVKKVVE